MQILYIIIYILRMGSVLDYILYKFRGGRATYVLYRGPGARAPRPRSAPADDGKCHREIMLSTHDEVYRKFAMLKLLTTNHNLKHFSYDGVKFPIAGKTRSHWFPGDISTHTCVCTCMLAFYMSGVPVRTYGPRYGKKLFPGKYLKFELIWP